MRGRHCQECVRGGAGDIAESLLVSKQCWWLAGGGTEAGGLDLDPTRSRHGLPDRAPYNPSKNTTMLGCFQQLVRKGMRQAEQAYCLLCSRQSRTAGRRPQTGWPLRWSAERQESSPLCCSRPPGRQNTRVHRATAAGRRLQEKGWVDRLTGQGRHSRVGNNDGGAGALAGNLAPRSSAGSLGRLLKCQLMRATCSACRRVRCLPTSCGRTGARVAKPLAGGDEPPPVSSLHQHRCQLSVQPQVLRWQGGPRGQHHVEPGAQGGDSTGPDTHAAALTQAGTAHRCRSAAQGCGAEATSSSEMPQAGAGRAGGRGRSLCRCQQAARGWRVCCLGAPNLVEKQQACAEVAHAARQQSIVGAVRRVLAGRPATPACAPGGTGRRSRSAQSTGL